jgi:hypothetical protein
MANSSR